jgi:hypothetical protein
MNSAKDIERAIESLPKSELKAFRAWFAKFDAEVWDSKIEEHILSGKLDRLGKAALRAHQNSDTKEI